MKSSIIALSTSADEHRDIAFRALPAGDMLLYATRAAALFAAAAVCFDGAEKNPWVQLAVPRAATERK